MDTFILALQLMTRLPIHREIEVTDQRLIRGIVLWPLVGLVEGLIDALAFVVLAYLLPKSLAAVLTVLCHICVTGGFHLDGLCDTADAIFSARNKERMLEIMKDSRVGTFGVIAACFDLGLRMLCLFELEHPAAAVLLVPVAGKCVQGLLMYRANYPRSSGMGAYYVGKIGAGTMAGSLIFGLVLIDLGLFLCGAKPLFLVLVPIVVILTAVVWRKYIEGKIDGMTGDTLGAGNEICEILLLLLLAAGERFLLW